MITVSITLDDYISAYRAHQARGRKLMYVGSIAVIAVGMAGFLLGAKPWPIIVACAGAGGILGQWWEDSIGLPKRARKLYQQFKGISDPATISWDAELIEAKGEHGHVKRKWTDYLRLKENDDLFLLYVTDELWDAVPKRCFASREQMDEFRRYASAARDP